MDLPTYAALVARMRKAQARYFREKSPQALTLAKTLESAVDVATRAILPGEADLFEGQSPPDDGAYRRK